jgi:hypothetical protein
VVVEGLVQLCQRAMANPVGCRTAGAAVGAGTFKHRELPSENAQKAIVFEVREGTIDDDDKIMPMVCVLLVVFARHLRRYDLIDLFSLFSSYMC